MSVSINARQFCRLSCLIMSVSITMNVAAQEIPKDSPIAAALGRAEEAVKAIVAVPDAQRNFDNTLGALDDMSTRLDDDTALTIFMQNVSTSADERAAARRAEEDLQNWVIALGKREDLYKAVKAFAATNPKLEGEQKRYLEHELRDYRRAGMDLAPEKREQLKGIEMEVAKLAIEFEKNIADDATRVPLTEAELAGVPQDILKTQPRIGELLLAGMDYPTFNGVLDFCENETTREKVWAMYKRRGGQKNVDLLEKVLKLRAQAAELVGYPNNAAYETEIRMAKNTATVDKFYSDLRPLVRKKAQMDFEELTNAKRTRTHDAGAKLHPWDQAFYKNILMKEKYAVDSEKVREYFPMQSVVDGLFSTTQSLYGLKYRDVTDQAAALKIKLWHPEVKLYEVTDTKTHEVLGHFAVDMFPRENKFSHAACWGLWARKTWANGEVQKPLAALVCNFTKPTPDKPSLLTHEEVVTFFHEFGHCLHNILSEARYGRFAGTSVARDFVEAPSQMFENWVWGPQVLKTFSHHYKTGEPLPDSLLEGMRRARYLASGMEAEHQFYYGMVDMRYHSAPHGEVDTNKVAQQTYTEVELYEPAPNTYFQASFGHLMGYNAGYYGYMWSLVYAQDMFQRFEELGLLSPEAGQYYRKKILARGGTMDEIDIVRDYLGREPKMDAFLRHLGLEPETARKTAGGATK